jgi:phosphatidylglycerol lysyltransferase
VSDERSRTLADATRLVLNHGWNSTCFQILNPGIQHWFSKDGDAVVGFVRAKAYRVVAGAPVCKLERLHSVVAEFEEDATAAGEHVTYFLAEARLEGELGSSKKHSFVLLGAQPVWTPANWQTIIAQNRSLRAQLNRARNKGVVVTEWPAEKATANPQLQHCLDAWLDSKGLPALHFMVEPDTLGRLEHRRIFVAEHNATVVGFINLSPVPVRNGWLFEQFPHRPGSPNGTVELMVHHAMLALAEADSDYATLGLAPLSTRAKIEPFDNPMWLRIFLAWLRKHAQRFYNFDGLDAFKAKLKPERWEPVFGITNEPDMSLATLRAIASAFSGGHTASMVAGGLWKASVAESRNVCAFVSRGFSGKEMR